MVNNGEGPNKVDEVEFGSLDGSTAEVLRVVLLEEEHCGSPTGARGRILEEQRQCSSTDKVDEVELRSPDHRGAGAPRGDVDREHAVRPGRGLPSAPRSKYPCATLVGP